MRIKLNKKYRRIVNLKGCIIQVKTQHRVKRIHFQFSRTQGAETKRKIFFE